MRIFGKSSTPGDRVPDVPAGRLITAVEVPAPPATANAGAPLSDGDVERLAAKVAERLVTGAMADTVRRVVAEVTERVVREEIARIRDAARTRT